MLLIKCIHVSEGFSFLFCTIYFDYCFSVCVVTVFSCQRQRQESFWDMDECRNECEIPEELTAADVVPRIRQKLLDLGLRGPVSIRIYGDLTGLDFQSSGDVKLHHFHAG